MKSLVIFAVASLILTMPAIAQTNTPEATGVPVPATPPAKPKMVCHEEEELGSRLGGHRECHTQQEWEAMARDQRQMLSQRQAQGGH